MIQKKLFETIAAFSLTIVFTPVLALGEEATSCAAKSAPAEAKEWTGTGVIAYGATGGNAVTETFSPSFQAQRLANGSKFDASGQLNYAEADHKATQNTAFGLFAYRSDFGDQKKFGDGTLYWGLATTAMHDDISDIDYRWDSFTGLGVHAIKSDIVQSDFEVGPGYRTEKESKLQRDYTIYRVGNLTSFQITPTSSFVVDTSIVSSAEELENWILFTQPKLKVMMTKIVSIELGLWYRYEDEPSRLAKKDDWVYTTGIGINF